MEKAPLLNLQHPVQSYLNNVLTSFNETTYSFIETMSNIDDNSFVGNKIHNFMYSFKLGQYHKDQNYAEYHVAKTDTRTYGLTRLQKIHLNLMEDEYGNKKSNVYTGLFNLKKRKALKKLKNRKEFSKMVGEELQKEKKLQGKNMYKHLSTLMPCINSIAPLVEHTYDALFTQNNFHFEYMQEQTRAEVREYILCQENIIPTSFRKAALYSSISSSLDENKYTEKQFGQMFEKFLYGKTKLKSLDLACNDLRRFFELLHIHLIPKTNIAIRENSNLYGTRVKKTPTMKESGNDDVEKKVEEEQSLDGIHKIFEYKEIMFSNESTFLQNIFNDFAIWLWRICQEIDLIIDSIHRRLMNDEEKRASIMNYFSRLFAILNRIKKELPEKIQLVTRGIKKCYTKKVAAELTDEKRNVDTVKKKSFLLRIVKFTGKGLSFIHKFLRPANAKDLSDMQYESHSMTKSQLKKFNKYTEKLENKVIELKKKIEEYKKETEEYKKEMGNTPISEESKKKLNALLAESAELAKGRAEFAKVQESMGQSLTNTLMSKPLNDKNSIITNENAKNWIQLDNTMQNIKEKSIENNTNLKEMRRQYLPVDDVQANQSIQATKAANKEANESAIGSQKFVENIQANTNSKVVPLDHVTKSTAAQQNDVASTVTNARITPDVVQAQANISPEAAKGYDSVSEKKLNQEKTETNYENASKKSQNSNIDSVIEKPKSVSKENISPDHPDPNLPHKGGKSDKPRKLEKRF